MTKTQRYITILQWFSIIFGICIASALVTQCFFPLDFDPSFFDYWHLRISYTSNKLLALEGFQRLSALAPLFASLVNSVTLAFLAAGAVYFYRLMGQLKKGISFSSNVLYFLHKLSKVALYLALFKPIRTILLSIIGALQAGQGDRTITLSINLLDIAVFISLMLVTALVQEGYRLQEERDLTV